MTAPPDDARRRALLRWGVPAAVLLVVLAVVLVLVLRDPDDADRGAAATGPATSSVPSSSASAPASTSSAAPSSSAAAPSSEPEDSTSSSTPGRADDSGARFEDSSQVAQDWVAAMAASDFDTAYAKSCAEVRRAADESADNGDSAGNLGQYFYDRVLGGVGITSASYQGARYDSASETDIARFTIAADDGSSIPLAVYVDSDGTVCDFR